ncbi:glycosyltransferase family 1 protein [Spirosoma pollinicola]|uniref:Glycosyl transferase n=1 Tax=Spirosoma pollinicola TaxID=2057025 RepID=A0A2K8YYJ3_9BACT|nr:glycosyltransferase family 1 protein [Spirosoma pollinicola]AUD02700.1 glycosyl transferase [Spirosoma pollinicola]
MKVPNSTHGSGNDDTLSISSTASSYSNKSVFDSPANDVSDLICFSHLRWNFVYQRPQHLLTRAAKNYKVWFIEEPIWSDRLYMSSCQQGERLTVLVPHLPHGTQPDEVIRLQRQLLDEFIAKERINSFVAWYYTPMALLFSDHLQPKLTVYDCMDELSAFWGAPPQLLNQEKRLIQKAGVLFTGGYSLYEAKQNRHPNVFAFPSSIDFSHFALARKPQPDPVDQRMLSNPRIGFSGVIDERFDYKLLGELAQRRPEWQFILLGPIVKIDRALLPNSPNVHYLGMKNYKDLPVYFSNWDVAILPFALNESTRFISPTKTPEYLAAGLPVVSTPIRDVIRMYGAKDYVQIADSAQTFEVAIDQALAARNSGNSGGWSAIDAFLNESSWDHTWNEMNRLMKAQMSVVVDQ